MAKLGAKQNSGNRGKMNKRKIPVIFLLCLLTLSTCGLEEEYDSLPQVSEGNISTEFNTKANITLASISNPPSYFTGYVIFYRIYISNSNYDTIITTINNISRISNDYNALYPYTNPANTSSIPSLNTFSSRGFYELELEGIDINSTILSTSGKSFSINFPTNKGDHPYIDDNGPQYKLRRSNGGGRFNPVPTDRYFFSSVDLNKYENAISTVNADVSGESGASAYAYASMYIVAVGQNTNTFQRVYGKPTFIGVFKLTDKQT